MKSFDKIEELIGKGHSLFINSSSEAETAFILSSILKRNILLIAGQRKDLLFENFIFFRSSCFELPASLFHDVDTIGKRFETLDAISKQKSPMITLSSPFSLIQKIVDKKELPFLLFHLKKGTKINLEERALKLGYTKASIVSGKGEFAVRGGIFDIFPASSSNPYRIELFGEEIDSLRIFDAASQKSIEKVDSLFLCPAVEEKKEVSIFDYLGKDTIVAFDDIVAIEDSLIKSGTSLPDIHNIKIFFSKHKIEELFPKCEVELFNWHIKVEKITSFLEPLPYDLGFHPNTKLRIIYETEKEKASLVEKIKEKNLSEHISYEKGYLSSGFHIPEKREALIPASKYPKLRHQVYRNIVSAPASEFHKLEINDPVVHLHCGIGKYLGIEKQKNNQGIEMEFLTIEYANNSKLFVPLSQAYLVNRYIGAKEEAPKLSILGSKKWHNVKLSAQKEIIGYAKDLLNLYAERAIQGGFIFPEDSDDQKLFEMEFPYSETVDQLKAIQDVKIDMQSTKAMDRLICGDVGYGKTEVAMRAAFKAVVDGKKQVAILVPTTILAMQHYENFKQRFNSFPVIIEIASRFNSVKTNREILKKTQEGLVDILIGTHRLLSKDIAFKDLGLIVIDEEQRFGVRSKEFLKKLKKNVDCISMSATPIPRTLYMSLINVKDMSQINTPPQDRLPIVTIMAENEDEVIKNAILRELAREGQLFFIHNRIESLKKRKEHIQTLVPHAKIIIVHGQMESDEIDLLFHEFKQNKADILMSTTIVENGVDIPNSNTIIIDRADTFGLADLYQLRGRVGRWNRTAYAYLITPKKQSLSDVAKKRLKALLESGSYGGGLKIAMRDLEIRGAGDILGVQQSGQISSIGFHLYCKFLKKTINALKAKASPILTDTKMEFPYDASIPESYIDDSSIRMEIYNRFGEASSNKELEELLSELSDRFNKPPVQVIWLYHLNRIRLFANNNQISTLILESNRISATKGTNKQIFPLIQGLKPDELEDYVIKALNKMFILA